MLYACDINWWERMAPAFDGLKVIGKGEYPGAHTIGVEVRNEMIWDGRALGGGGNSGFQALNMAVLFGAKRCILLGYDFQDAGNHWHGRHPQGFSQTNETSLKTWIGCMNAAAKKLQDIGVDVVNASRETALTCFPRMTIGEALDLQ